MVTSIILGTVGVLFVVSVVAGLSRNDDNLEQLGDGLHDEAGIAFPPEVIHGTIAPEGWGRILYCEIVDPELHDACKTRPDAMPAGLMLGVNIGPVVRYDEEQKILTVLDGHDTSVYYWHAQSGRRLNMVKFRDQAMELHTELRERFELGPYRMCPRCDQRIMINARRKIEARGCPTCGGLFVEGSSSELVANVLGITPGAVQASPESTAVCTSCHMTMRRVQLPQRQLDVCGHCGGIYFHYGEADDIPALMKI